MKADMNVDMNVETMRIICFWCARGSLGMRIACPHCDGSGYVEVPKPAPKDDA